MRFFLIFSLFISLLTFSLNIEPAHALSVSPAIKEISLKAGENKQIKIFLHNDDVFSQKITLDIQNFKDSAVPGIPQIYKNKEIDVAKWISLNERSVILAPDSRHEIIATVHPPKSAIGGTYFSILVNAEQLTLEENTNVNTRQTVAVLLFMSVEGKIEKSLKIFDFTVQSVPLIFFPSSFSYTLKNIGNTHIKPEGQIRINNIVSPYIRSINLNPEHLIVLPDTKRVIQVDWPDSNHIWWSPLNPFRFGIYDAELYFEDMKLQGAVRTRFIIISPMSIMIVLSVGIFLLYNFYRKKLTLTQDS